MSWIITGKEANPPLLDAYPGAAAAYSLRQLQSGSYPVVRVRRDSDNAEQDFTATEVSDGTLAAWVGAGNNGFVRTWYDQSGSSSNAVQSDAALQPKIVSSGVLVVHSGKPAISFTGGLVRLTSDGLRNRARLDSFIVKNTSDIQYMLFSGLGPISFVTESASPNLLLTQGYGASPILYANSGQFSGTTRENVYSFLNGYKLECHQASSTTGWPVFDIGCYNRSTLFDFVGTIQELIFYASDQSASRAAIENAINAHYSIY